LAVAASLRRRRPIAALARLASAAGVRAWIVGGAPRDGLLGREDLDVDIAVSGDPEALARRLEALGFGTAVAISERAPRVFRVAGRRPVDLAELEGDSIGQDLARRDFTANAIAIDLQTGAWIDPFGGIGDLAKRRLRLVRESNLIDDPLRAFRAARLYATHELRPDPRTLAACRVAAPGLERTAAERIQTELAKMLEADCVAGAFRWAEKAGLLSPALGLELPSSRWKVAARNLARLDGSPTAALEGRRRRILRLAAISAGLELQPATAAQWLRRRRHARADAGAVARLLELVGAAPAACSQYSRWAWLYDAGEQAEDALSLLEASHPRRGALARRLAGLDRHARRGPAVSGADLIRWLGEKPGPAVGRLLREVGIEVLAGNVRTRPEARRWLICRNAPSVDGDFPKIVRRIEKHA
jgi:tRNA nucleotidyltransferase (CCA-adding enzyme)